MPRRWKVFISLVSLVIFLDQLTKHLARTRLPVGMHGGGVRVPVIEHYFDWVLSFNTGSAFSLFRDASGARVFLTAVGLVAVCAIVWLVHRSRDRQIGVVAALALMAGGALGNLIDRIHYGQVTDFVLWHYYEHTFPVFNVADVCLSVAVAVFLAASLVAARREHMAGSAEAATR